MPHHQFPKHDLVHNLVHKAIIAIIVQVIFVQLQYAVNNNM